MSIRICGGRYRSIRLDCPTSRVRPTTDRVKEAIFSTLVHDLEDSIVLDLFAGSGSLGIEAISRGASQVTFVEKSQECIKVIERNIETIGAQQRSIIIKSDVRTYIDKCPASFDLIFMDPPYHKDLASQLAPHVYNLLNIGGILVVEHSIREDVPLAVWKSKRYGDTAISYFIRSAQ
ncbi:MAG: 16S rRNA (guanine(966)-N(2))-methyltransferase RsmD [Desulfomonilia bacterium]